MKFVVHIIEVTDYKTYDYGIKIAKWKCRIFVIPLEKLCIAFLKNPEQMLWIFGI